MIGFVSNANDTITVQQDGKNVAGIAERDGVFVVTPANGIALDVAPAGSLAVAQELVALALGETLPRSGASKGSARKGSGSTSRKGSGASARKDKNASASAPASKGSGSGASKGKDAKSSPARERKVSEVMQRNIAELAQGNYPVFVESAELVSSLRSSRATRALVDAGFMYRNGTGNIYPTPAQAKKIARAYPGTSLALQCELGGYTAWRNSLRKRASVSTEVSSAA